MLCISACSARGCFACNYTYETGKDPMHMGFLFLAVYSYLASGLHVRNALTDEQVIHKRQGVSDPVRALRWGARAFVPDASEARS